ncbi:MAG TPA: hypothetical protein PK033_16035 [Acetivibrio sp.]|jgi:hypothetical protein|nr:hypothetical protein [Acetivibrio sp.]
MEKRQVIIGLKSPREFTYEERKMILDEYFQTGCKKRDIWKKYTGQPEEKGYLLKWMRQLGYEDIDKRCKLTLSNNNTMSKRTNETAKNVQLKQKIEQLEKALVQSELRATALDTMIDIAEKELKINIRKKSNTKQSLK